ncbi:helix-turn-helix transcriptional regulator [Phenylobacterium sp.]|uniref:helix-turn-helix transcriptional regulator n=1 Tax=Phenylobacterium sp. TaxID=1871053 RepID=UPI0027180A0F|nr:helix-turn-helix transcriptional regulator [Phenylobacterium sp.]MDO8801316.1 helix-turn-helix transcriptional regulator [Phenylobacterium sp.]
MSVSIPETPPDAAAGFPRLLREWRQKRRLSQLGLALSSGVSQRHVSFLESGRANPSRNMILQLSETLEVPLRDRNLWLTAAGFAPIFQVRALDDPQMALVMSAVRMMLKAHEPFPAIALDRAWNVRLSNKPFDRLGAMLGEDIWTRVGGDQRNLMRLFFHPQGIRPFVTNWSAVGPLMWRRAQREAEALGGLEMKAVLDDLAPLQNLDVLWSPADTALLPVMPFNMQIRDLKISMFAVVATFGAAQDVTADELRLETLFPADAETEALFRGAAAGSKP